MYLLVIELNLVPIQRPSLPYLFPPLGKLPYSVVYYFELIGLNLLTRINFLDNYCGLLNGPLKWPKPSLFFTRLLWRNRLWPENRTLLYVSTNLSRSWC